MRCNRRRPPDLRTNRRFKSGIHCLDAGPTLKHASQPPEMVIRRPFRANLSLVIAISIGIERVERVF
jgi:hypothetical protein